VTRGRTAGVRVSVLELAGVGGGVAVMKCGLSGRP
jgi:hypothetical protein